MIYTSYYARAKNFLNMTHIRISTSAPKWYPVETKALPELYPGFDLVNAYKSGQVSETEYVRQYREKLDRLDKTAILQKIEQLSDGNDALLLCYEKDGDFCHRHLVSEWLGNITELPKTGLPM